MMIGSGRVRSGAMKSTNNIHIWSSKDWEERRIYQQKNNGKVHFLWQQSNRFG